MAIEINDRNLTPTISAFKFFISECLVDDGSLFLNATLWTAENIAAVKHSFVDRPDASSDDFGTKLKRQMSDAVPDAQRLMAEMLWALLLFPSNLKTETKRRPVREIWTLTNYELGPYELGPGLQLPLASVSIRQPDEPGGGVHFGSRRFMREAAAEWPATRERTASPSPLVLDATFPTASFPAADMDASASAFACRRLALTTAA